MKLSILSADGQGRIESVLMQNVLCNLPDRVASIHEADAVIVPISHYHDYSFHRELESVRKPVIIMDMMEYYGEQPQGTHIFGVNEAPSHSYNPEWNKFHQWLEANPPSLYFKRELYEADRTESVIPIEWPCYMPAWDIEPESNFNARPFEVFYNWGHSNALRPVLHGAMFRGWGAGLGYEVISSFDHIDAKIHEPGRKWISIHSPHTHRTHINEIVLRQSQSKMSVSMPGAGKKCFRSTEHILHTVPVRGDETGEWSLAWSYPWVHGQNYLSLDLDDFFNLADEPELEEFLHDYATNQKWNLYQIYLGARELAENYRIHNYVNNYILPAIRSRL